MSQDNPIALRHATAADLAALESLTREATLALASADYSPAQLTGALAGVLAIDRQLIDDATYFVVEEDGQLLACGGWCRRVTRFDDFMVPQPGTRNLDPQREAAGLRAIFVRPARARQGLGSRVLAACEKQAADEGFKAMETGATLPGVRLYREHGYQGGLALEHQMPGGVKMRIVPMHKTL